MPVQLPTVLFLGFVGGFDPLPLTTLDGALAGQAAAVAGIHSLSIRIKEFQTDFASRSDSLKLVVEYTYRMQGDRERLTTNDVMKAATADGDHFGYSDLSNGPEGFREISGYDPSHPVSLGECSPSHAFGTLGLRKIGDESPRKKVRGDLLLEMYNIPKSLSLGEFATTAASAKLVATPSESPRRCYEIEILRPKFLFQVSLDPAANFMIRRVESRDPAAKNPEDRAVVEVQSFKDCGDGVFLPVSVKAVLKDPSMKKPLRVRTECEILSCNQEIPAADLRVSFPDWLCVGDRVTGKIHYGGANDTPRLTFNSSEEHRRWWLPRLAKAGRAKPFPWSLIAAGITVLLFAVLMIRRLMKRRESRQLLRA